MAAWRLLKIIVTIVIIKKLNELARTHTDLDAKSWTTDRDESIGIPDDAFDVGSSCSYDGTDGKVWNSDVTCLNGRLRMLRWLLLLLLAELRRRRKPGDGCSCRSLKRMRMRRQASIGCDGGGCRRG